MRGQTRLYNIGKNCCLAWAYIYCSGRKFDILNYTKLVLDAQKRGFIDLECNVLDGTKLMRWLTGDNTIRVTHKRIESIKNIKEPTPVKYYNLGYEHFVVIKNGEIVFNEWDNSISIGGRPISARIISRG